jgi:hypothetical protein
MRSCRAYLENVAQESTRERFFGFDFDEGTLDGLTLCEGCAGLGCPSADGDNGTLVMNADWHRVCAPQVNRTSVVDTQVVLNWENSGVTRRFGLSQRRWLDAIFTLNPGTPDVSFQCRLNGVVDITTMTAPVDFETRVRSTWTLTRIGDEFTLDIDGVVFGDGACPVGPSGALSVYVATYPNVRQGGVLDSMTWAEAP